MELPEFLSPPPEKEARELGLEAIVFDPVAQDAEARAAAPQDDGMAPLGAFLLLDASINPDIAIFAEAFSEPARCLFDGAAFEDLSEVGPWLIELRRYGDAWDWFVEDGYAQNWGIVIHSRLPLLKLKTQMKKFIKIKDEDDETYFFKFYRPEHLSNYLPAFDDKQRASFMRGIEAIFAETLSDPDHLQRFSMDDEGKLTTQKFNLVETGMPLRIQPPSEDEVAAILARAAEPDAVNG